MTVLFWMYWILVRYKVLCAYYGDGVLRKGPAQLRLVS